MRWSHRGALAFGLGCLITFMLWFGPPERPASRPTPEQVGEFDLEKRLEAPSYVDRVEVAEADRPKTGVTQYLPEKAYHGYNPTTPAP